MQTFGDDRVEPVFLGLGRIFRASQYFVLNPGSSEGQAPCDVNSSDLNCHSCSKTPNLKEVSEINAPIGLRCFQRRGSVVPVKATALLEFYHPGKSSRLSLLSCSVPSYPSLLPAADLHVWLLRLQAISLLVFAEPTARQGVLPLAFMS